MWRKLDVFERRLKNEKKFEKTGLEKFLIEKISAGEFDNNFSKKGRKKNYNDFFDKELIQDYLYEKE